VPTLAFLRRRMVPVPSGASGRPADAGAAIVEFVMVSVLLVFLLFGVIQVAAALYVRNVVAASVADAAHYIALRGVPASEGARRASELIARALSARMSADLPCTGSVGVDSASGLPVARVECRGRIKSIFLPAMAFVSIDVVCHALKETG
jgi:Flp pilus assembly protein TadG